MILFLFLLKRLSVGTGEAVLTSNHDTCKPQFYYIKVGYKGCKLHGCVIMMNMNLSMLHLTE